MLRSMSMPLIVKSKQHKTTQQTSSSSFHLHHKTFHIISSWRKRERDITGKKRKQQKHTTKDTRHDSGDMNLSGLSSAAGTANQPLKIPRRTYDDNDEDYNRNDYSAASPSSAATAFAVPGTDSTTKEKIDLSIKTATTTTDMPSSSSSSSSQPTSSSYDVEGVGNGNARGTGGGDDNENSITFSYETEKENGKKNNTCSVDGTIGGSTTARTTTKSSSSTTTRTMTETSTTASRSSSSLLFKPSSIDEEDEEDGDDSDDDDSSDDDSSDDDDDDDSDDDEYEEDDEFEVEDFYDDDDDDEIEEVPIKDGDESLDDVEAPRSQMSFRGSFHSNAEMSMGDLSCLLDPEDDDLDRSGHLSTRSSKTDHSETKKLVRKENKAVFWGRVVAVGTIAVLGGLLAYVVFWLGENDVSPAYATVAVVAAFLLSLVVFMVYDYMVRRRHRKMIQRAHEARAIVSSLFPANVRDRLFETTRAENKKHKMDKKERKKKKNKKKKNKKKKKKGKKSKKGPDGIEGIEISSGDDDDDDNKSDSPDNWASQFEQSIRNIVDGSAELTKTPLNRRRGNVSHPKHQLKSFLNTTPTLPESEASETNDTDDGLGVGMDKPIADLFPHTSVLFADIVGFTAWSSEREPAQVFTLLQSLYQAFDRIAKRRGVFKVETIGDCYVAVTGLPDPQADHAVRMTKFAREIMIKAEDVTKNLEVKLGPDTGDLCLRVGINSGPVTAGVLQGEKSRFQLFGDTVNTASRMESTGQPDAVQVSASTAELLMKAGKTYWIKAREDLVHAKGKGKVQTYWVVSKGTQGLELNRSQHASEAMGKPAAMKGRPGLSRGMSTRPSAPSRTRSTFTSGEPTRGVQRTTSDSVAKAATANKISSSKEADEAAARREERLVQWQLDLFSRLLKRIVVARLQKNRRREELARAQEPSTSVEEESESQDVVLPLQDTKPRFNMAQRESSFRGLFPPSKRTTDRGLSNTLHSEFSMDGVSILSQSLGDLSFGQSFATQNSASDLGWSKDLSGDLSIGDCIVVDEVAEVIEMPKFDKEVDHVMHMNNIDDVKLDEAVVSQLNDYIATIAHMYRKNPFHNFEHASHVTMSANKLLNRIVTPESVNYDEDHAAVAEQLFDYTYGITSDPLTQFAVMFSALVHDVDHTGVSNPQLAKENPDLASLYRNKSIAEQNSVDLAWDLFLDPRYKDLQDCISSDPAEQKRFRQLVINSVMATDIFDPDMKKLRNTRWDKAFHVDAVAAEERKLLSLNADKDRNIKATIVIEHIIQASDVAHTMQHWHIYTKWNERLFEEMMSAYECGRSEKSPADGWYKGELWFFDNYVIPLAKKLNECNVFGVSSDECLNYATANRNEWQIKGEEIVQQMVQRYHKKKFSVSGIARKPRKREPTRISAEA